MSVGLLFWWMAVWMSIVVLGCFRGSLKFRAGARRNSRIASHAGTYYLQTKYVSFRLDLRDFVVPQEVLGIGRTTNNITVLGGFSLWLG